MFQMASFSDHASWRQGAALGLTALLMLGATSAQAGGRVAKNVGAISIHAGPSPDYPLVRHLPSATTSIQVQGCLPDYRWCDVSIGAYRGWALASDLRIQYDGFFHPVARVAPVVGLPVVSFSIGPYWSTYYRNQPWYDDPRWAPAIESYRVQSRVGNTTIEVERSWHPAPQYVAPPPAVYYEAPPVVIVPPQHRPPPPVYVYPARPPGYYQAPPTAYYPPPGHRPPPGYRPPDTMHQPPAIRPAPGRVPTPGVWHDPIQPQPGFQPGSRPYPPGAIIQGNQPGHSTGSRVLK